jgi:hypothetical protein
MLLRGEVDAFLRDVRWGWVDWAERHLRNLEGRVRGLSAPVRSAAGRILSQRPYVRGREEASLATGTYVWTAPSVAASPDYLSRSARGADLDLALLNDRWHALLAVVVWLEEPTWERVALRMEYASGTGINALFHRVTGMSPTKFEGSGMSGLGWRLGACRRVFPLEGAEEV